MALEDFEKSLAEDQTRRREKSDRHHRHRDRDRSRDRDRARHHRHHHHRRSSRSRERRSDRHGESRRSEDDGHRHKRSRHSTDHGDDRDHKRRHRRGHSRERGRGEESIAEEVAEGVQENEQPKPKRDAWMEAPSSLDVDYVHRRDPTRLQEEPKPRMLGADFELKLHEKELNHHLRDLKDGKALEEIQDEPAQHEVDYTFGDAGSNWRMTKLRAVYRESDESGRAVEEIAMDRFGDLRSFDDAREEEAELDRRDRYGEGYVGKEKPSGELFQERKLEANVHRDPREHVRSPEKELEARGQGQPMETVPPPNTSQPLDLTALNRLKAQMMKAKLKGAADAAELEERYNVAAAAMANRKEPDTVVLGVMQNRMLAGKRNEVKAIDTKRGRERGQVEDNEDMSIEDMVREERRTRDLGDGKRMAERIAKDAKFENDLEYMDDNASKLAKRVQRSEINLKNTTINEMQKMNRILDNCPLCHHEDTNTPPVAPVVSLATRVFLTLPTEPEVSEGSTTIVPMQHRTNLLECDDDEWEEIRNFMKSLTRMYHEQGRDVIFYENAAQPHRRRHAAMEAVPLPYDLGETAPAFFKEAILSSDAEWTQHRKLIDTLSQAKKAGMGRNAFRRSLAKEVPYFHVWFELDGGLGHVVEDENRWPRGDLFAREIIGGMLDVGPEVIKRQGRRHRGGDRRVEGFQRRWRKFDWTRVLVEG